MGSGTTPKSGNSAYYEEGDHPWINTSDVQDCEINHPRFYITDKALEDYPVLKYYPEGTVLLAMYGGGTIGNVGIMKFPSTINQACCAMIPHIKIIKTKFLFYYLQAHKYKIISLGFGGSQINVSQSIIAQIPVALPPLAYQQRIVDYLDEKLSAIDRRVENLEKQKNIYARLRKSVIHQAVTRGLNPDVHLKDSGIDWIGMIPEHWNRYRLKDLGYMYSGLTGKSGDDFRCDDESKTKPYVPFTNVLNNTVVDIKNFHYVVMGQNEQQNRVKVNDLLFLMSSEDYESIAKSAVVKNELGEVYLNSFCRGLRITNKNCYAPFLNYQLNSELYRDALRFEARGFTRINIKIDRVAGHFASLPPFLEQITIAKYLDDKCAKIDAANENINKQIDASKRLKRALINEVITGQRAV